MLQKRLFISFLFLLNSLIVSGQGNNRPYAQPNPNRANPFRVIISHIIHAHSLITPGANVKRAKGTSIDNEDIMPRNNLNLGISSLALNTINLSYERSFYYRLTGIVNVGYTLPSPAIDPVKNVVQDYYNSSSSILIQYPTVSRLSVLAGIRQYVRQNLKGWYFQPFGQWTNNNVEMPINFFQNPSNNLNDLLEGKINSIHLGITTGIHFDIKQKISLDVQLGGIDVGQFKGELSSKNNTNLYSIGHKIEIKEAYKRATEQTLVNKFPDVFVNNNNIKIGGTYNKLSFRLSSIRVGYRF